MVASEKGSDDGFATLHLWILKHKSRPCTRLNADPIIPFSGKAF